MRKFISCRQVSDQVWLNYRGAPSEQELSIGGDELRYLAQRFALTMVCTEPERHSYAETINFDQQPPDFELVESFHNLDWQSIKDALREQHDVFLYMFGLMP